MNSANRFITAKTAGSTRNTAAAAPAAEYLTFRLGDEEYGIDILKVQEIRSYEQPTRMAQNVSGTVLGVVVDAVADVVALTRDTIKAAPQFQTQVDAAFVTGIAKVGDRMLMMMDIESLLSSTEMGLVMQVAQQ